MEQQGEKKQASDHFVLVPEVHDHILMYWMDETGIPCDRVFVGKKLSRECEGKKGE